MCKVMHFQMQFTFCCYCYLFKILFLINNNYYIITEEGLRPVLEATVGVNNWHKLSIALGLPPYLQSHDSTEVIQRWLDYGSASWYKLVEALKNPLVAQKGLADKITAAHKK